MIKKKVHDDIVDEEIDMMTDTMLDDLPDVSKPAKKPRKKLPGWVIIPAIGLVVLVFFIGSKVLGGNADSAKELATVEVKTGDIKESYNASGIVESEQKKVYYSPVNAPVNQLNAKVGDVVKAGDLLVEFDTKNLERDNKQSELNALTAKYTNQDAVEQAKRAAKDAADAKAKSNESVDSIKGQIAEKKKQIEELETYAREAGDQAAQVAESIAAMKQMQQEILDRQSVVKAEKENAERQVQALDKESEEYQQELINAQNATNELSELEQEYRKLEQELAALESAGANGNTQALAAAQAELSTLESSLAQMEKGGVSTPTTGLTSGQKKNMANSEDLAEITKMTTEELLAKGREGIKADFDGLIADVKALSGSSAVLGGELLTLVNNSEVRVRLEVPANDFDKLVVGKQAEIKLGQKKYKGTLQAVDKVAVTNLKGNPVIKADVHIDNPDENIYIGVSAKATLDVAEKKNVMSVPNEVVNTSAAGDFVYIIEDGVVKKQMVELGIASKKETEVISGLKAGQQVVSDVSGDVKEGMKANPVAGKE